MKQETYNLINAAILATKKAKNKAIKINVPQVIEKNGNLYEINIIGEIRFLKKLNKPVNNLPKKFKLT
jgi:hypothetical protein